LGGSGKSTPFAEWRKVAAAALHLKPYSSPMEVRVRAETAKRLHDLAAASGRTASEIVEDALAGYLEEVASVGKTLDSRYDDLKSGRVKPIDGETQSRSCARRASGAARTHE
jgi:predicted DNA-binding protein